MEQQIRERFTALVAPADGSLEGHLDLGAFLIAAALQPKLDIAHELQRVDELAAGCHAETAAELAISLFGGAGHDPTVHFGGNHGEYYDEANSLLNRVLDRKIGIPITLAVVLIEVGRRREISLHGVGMPGHFLVGSADGYIDAFNGGVLLDTLGCGRLFERLAGSGAQLPPGSLEPTPPALILKRMLVNLSAIGANQQQRRTLYSVRALLAAYPDADHRDHVQHAYAAAEVGQFGEAASAGERALSTIPEQVRDKLQTQIGGWRARLN